MDRHRLPSITPSIDPGEVIAPVSASASAPTPYACARKLHSDTPYSTTPASPTLPFLAYSGGPPPASDASPRRGVGPCAMSSMRPIPEPPCRQPSIVLRKPLPRICTGAVALRCRDTAIPPYCDTCVMPTSLPPLLTSSSIALLHHCCCLAAARYALLLCLLPLLAAVARYLLPLPAPELH